MELGRYQNQLLAGIALLVAGWAALSLLHVPNISIPPITDSAFPEGRDPRMYFEQSIDNSQAFYARGADYALALSRRGALLSVRNATERSDLGLSFPGANSDVELVADGATQPLAHYYVGNDPWAWRRNVKLHERVVYRNLYAGIDAVFYGRGTSFEYDFVVAPQADVSRVTLRFENYRRLSIDDDGNLVLETGSGTVRQRRPVAYQSVNGKRVGVVASYSIGTNGDVQMRIGSYDPNLPLIIDPTVDFSTYFGGAKSDYATRVAVDKQGNSYLVGYTFSPTVGATEVYGTTTSPNDLVNVFVTKYLANGTLDFIVYLGGSHEDYGRAITVNENGAIYIAGETQSADFPRLQSKRQFGGGWDAFVTVLASNAELIYSGLLGGTGSDYGHGLAVRTNGDVFVAGETWSVDFPVTAATAFSKTCGCGPDTYDGFLAVLDIATDSIKYGTYFGGSGNDKIHTVDVSSSSGIAYVAGETFSTDLPIVRGVQKNNAGASDMLFAAIDPARSGTESLIYSTYLGGESEDIAEQVVVNKAGHVYVAGTTQSANLLTKPKNAFQSSRRGLSDALVAKLNPAAADGASLLYLTYYGGSGDETAEAVAVDSADAAVIAGMTSSADLPTVSPVQRSLAGAMDGYVAALSVGGNAMQYATYQGGSGNDSFNGVAVDPGGALVAAGDTESGNFPVTSGAPQTNASGNTDAMLVAIDPSGATPTGSTSGANASSPKASGGGATDIVALVLGLLAFRLRRNYCLRS